MYKIMIADDEGIVIDTLKFIIEKNLGDQCIIKSAKTGRKVMELAEYFCPDIAFMDIQMPGINGIEAMKEIRKGNSNVIFIVASTFDKFDYAKEAIGIDVLKYIKKPIDKNVIVEVLNQAINQVDDVKEKRSSDLANKEKLEIVTPIIENGFIHAFLYQNREKEELENFKTLLGIETCSGYMMAVQFGVLTDEERMGNIADVSVRLQKEYHKIREKVKSYFECCVSNMLGNLILVFVPLEIPDQMDEYEFRIQIIDLARKMVRDLRSSFRARFRAGIGSVYHDDDMTLSYHEAMKSLTYDSTDSVVHVNDLPLRCNYETDYPIDVEKKLFKYIQEGNLNKSVYYAKCFFEWMIENYSSNMIDIKLKVLEFVLQAEHIGYESGGMFYRFTGRSEYLQNIMEIKEYQQLEAWLETKIENVCCCISIKKEENMAAVVAKGQIYIEENYQKDIFLDDVSRQLNISPYYFSKVFKKKVGKNFIEYLTDVRMEKAKELLRNSSKSIKEICLEVGYADSSYFSRIFKKNVGVSQREYKEENR